MTLSDDDIIRIAKAVARELADQAEERRVERARELAESHDEGYKAAIRALRHLLPLQIVGDIT